MHDIMKVKIGFGLGYWLLTTFIKHIISLVSTFRFNQLQYSPQHTLDQYVPLEREVSRWEVVHWSDTDGTLVTVHRVKCLPAFHAPYCCILWTGTNYFLHLAIVVEKGWLLGTRRSSSSFCTSSLDGAYQNSKYSARASKNQRYTVAFIMKCQQ